jgi:hypothetical protein
MKNIKVYLKKEIRRYRVSKNISFLDFQKLINNESKNSKYLYEDEEKEWITFSSNKGLTHALRNNRIQVLKIKVKEKRIHFSNIFEFYMNKRLKNKQKSLKKHLNNEFEIRKRNIFKNDSYQNFSKNIINVNLMKELLDYFKNGRKYDLKNYENEKIKLELISELNKKFAVVKNEKIIPEIFQNQIDVLNSMGFNDTEKNLISLTNFKGNIDKTIDEILKSTKL